MHVHLEVAYYEHVTVAERERVPGVEIAVVDAHVGLATIRGPRRAVHI